MLLARILLLLGTLAAGSITVVGADAPSEKIEFTKENFPVLMQTRKATYVRRGAFRGSAVTARVYRGAVLRLAPSGGTRGCAQGWMKRFGGGFICRKHLKRTAATKMRATPLDNPNLIDGFDAYKVVKHGPRLYRGIKKLRSKNPYVTLRKGSVLVVRDSLVRKGRKYFETRKGWYVEAENMEKLPPRIDTLAVGVDNANPAPLGVVIRDAHIRSEPTGRAKSVGRLKRWDVIPRGGAEAPVVEGGWIRLGQGRYAKDDHVARVRPAPIPKGVGNHERWLAVDVKEQLLLAYEGTRLVRIIPCSTGKKGNTSTGRYRIQWKRRAQTMRLRMGQVRVEDVQWVMYYNRRASIAIHTAYWHHDFGTPVSHGCVNLPIQDARWVFEWTTPHPTAEDSERFPTPYEPGSRVVVF